MSEIKGNSKKTVLDRHFQVNSLSWWK